MKCFLLAMTINGIKNIEKTLKLEFYNKTLIKFNPCQHNIKGIFAPNGAGKTAIIKSVDILKKIALNKNYLLEANNKFILSKIINKKLLSSEIKLVFLVVEGNYKYKYEHSIKLKILNNDIVIEAESIKRMDNKNKVIKEFLNENGIIKIDTLSNNKEKLKEDTKNLLNSNSVLNVVNEVLNKFGKDYERIINFYKNIFVKIDKKDEHFLYSINETLFLNTENFDNMGNYNYKIYKNRLIEFEKYLTRLKAFIKLFKPNVKNISYEKKEDAEFYYINILLNYDTYNIDLEFESMGIKNLFHLFWYFKKIYDDKIILIDEIDVNIHDVYLNRLIEFFAEEGKGQLIFTTHNITLLETLRKYKHSIDFINDDSEVIEWVKKGNSNPFRVYKDGYIKGLPFNIIESDFFNIFNDEASI